MEQVEITPQYLTYRQAEELTGLSRQTVWRLIKSGDVRAFKIGRGVKIERRSLEDYVQAEPIEAE